MRDILICFTLLTGSILMVFASIGLVRFRDALCRAHALAKATTFGICLMLAGFLIAIDDAVSGLKILLVICFLLLTIPLASHLVCLLSHRQTERDNKLRAAKAQEKAG